jgi:hypothetical protein
MQHSAMQRSLMLKDDARRWTLALIYNYTSLNRLLNPTKDIHFILKAQNSQLSMFHPSFSPTAHRTASQTSGTIFLGR